MEKPERQLHRPGNDLRHSSMECFSQLRPSQSLDILEVEVTPVPEDAPRKSAGAANVQERPSCSCSSHTQNPPEPPLRYRRTPFWVLIAYSALLVVPWILTCILEKRPLTAPTYHDQRGRVNQKGYRGLWSTLAAVNGLRTLSGVVTIPVTSTTLGYVAIPFAQRRHPGQKLSMLQLFALADHGWVDINILWNSWNEGRSSKLLWYGALITIIGAIQQPLQSALVSTKSMAAVSCADLPFKGCGKGSHFMIGYDTDPRFLQKVDHKLVIERVAKSLATISDKEIQTNLWMHNPILSKTSIALDDPGTMGDFERGKHEEMWDTRRLEQQSLSYYLRDPNDPKSMPNSTFFVTRFANGTGTGVLREHAIQLNSTISCEPHDFPSVCKGKGPSTLEIRRRRVSLSVCVPGEMGESPWSLSRNRQDIQENLYIAYNISVTVTERLAITMRCSVNASLGYFELPNIMNGGRSGSLLQTWPDNKTIHEEFNDYDYEGTRLSETDSPDDGVYDLPSMDSGFSYGPIIPAPGPLMSAAQALFGNGSFLRLVAENATKLTPSQTLAAICRPGDIPFSQVTATFVSRYWHMVVCLDPPQDIREITDIDYLIDKVVSSFLGYFEEPYMAEYVLEIAVFLANQATLQAATPQYSARPIYFSPGTLFAKPTKSLAATIAISILIFLQLSGLAMLVRYAMQVPTWTSSPNAITMAQIGRAMKDSELPPIGPVRNDHLARLGEIDALVGIAENSDIVGSYLSGSDKTIAAIPTPSTGIKLALGGHGFITRDVIHGKPRRRWRGKETKEGHDSV